MDIQTIERLIHSYNTWLGGKITRGSRHLELIELMFRKEFVWVVANDDNRIEDGLDLRREFLLDIRFFSAFQLDQMISSNTVVMSIMNDWPPSVLEVLIGLSRRLAFADGGIPEVWAWRLVENLELHKMRDPLTPRKRDRINESLDALIFRTYKADGVGGFFPLAFPEQDQTQVEIWYQMSSWLAENPDV